MPEPKRTYHQDAFVNSSLRLEPTNSRRERTTSHQHSTSDLNAETFNSALIEKLIKHIKEK